MIHTLGKQEQPRVQWLGQGHLAPGIEPSGLQDDLPTPELQPPCFLNLIGHIKDYGSWIHREAFMIQSAENKSHHYV